MSKSGVPGRREKRSERRPAGAARMARSVNVVRPVTMSTCSKIRMSSPEEGEGGGAGEVERTRQGEGGGEQEGRERGRRGRGKGSGKGRGRGRDTGLSKSVKAPRHHVHLPLGGGVRIHPENARMSGRHGVQYVAQCAACAARTPVVWQYIRRDSRSGPISPPADADHICEHVRHTTAFRVQGLGLRFQGLGFRV